MIRYGALIRWAATLLSVALLLGTPTLGAAADDLLPKGPDQQEFLPPNSKGPVVIVVSGQSGPLAYRAYSARVASLGYYTVLIDGKDVLTRQPDGGFQTLRTVIQKAQSSPNAGGSGKVALIGFSLGGGAVLAHAGKMPDLISAAVAYYPATFWIRNIDDLASRIQFPFLLLAAERDTYQNCCLVETARKLQQAAKEKNTSLQLVVYPNADHGFNLDGPTYRGTDTEDAWRKTTEMLARYHAAVAN